MSPPFFCVLQGVNAIDQFFQGTQKALTML